MIAENGLHARNLYKYIYIGTFIAAMPNAAS